MTLSLYDTLSREKRPFEPTDPERVSLYLCGPTVYDYAHIGNARPAVVFDVLFRLLQRVYGPEHVVYARNVTDVDDKINAKAAKEGVPIAEITARYEKIYLDDMARLNVTPPTLTPHVTDHMDAITGQIAALVARGHAYAAEGHVLFDVGSFADYGALSGRTLDDMIAGARVEVAPYKKNPHDFVLWKPSKPGEPSWPSPWGEGRPGWHIECSAMIEANLGFPIDIHAGGIDLVFPHHENEVAQGRCAHGDRVYARYWLHNGFLTMNAEKMSKSEGNVVLLHDLVKDNPGEVIRWALLGAHYRAPLDWNAEQVALARRNLDRLYGVLLDAKSALKGADLDGPHGGTQSPAELEGVQAALEDDLNTPKAMSELFALGDQLRAALLGTVNPAAVRLLRDALVSAGGYLGVLQTDPEAWFQGGADEGLKTRIDGLIEGRDAARKAKDWPAADRIRDELNSLNVLVMDGPEGATWRFKEPA